MVMYIALMAMLLGELFIKSCDESDVRGLGHLVDLTISPPPQFRTSPRFGWVGRIRLFPKTAHICMYVLLFGFGASWLDRNKRNAILHF